MVFEPKKNPEYYFYELKINKCKSTRVNAKSISLQNNATTQIAQLYVVQIVVVIVSHWLLSISKDIRRSALQVKVCWEIYVL